MSSNTSRAIVRAEYLLAIEPMISTEETRYYLNGVYIEPHPAGGATLVATDGHKMGIIYDQDAIVMGQPQIWFKEAIGKAALRKPLSEMDKSYGDTGKSWADLQTAIGTPDSVRLVRADSATAVLLAEGLPFYKREALVKAHEFVIDGTFPEYRRVVPTLSGDEAFVPSWFNGAYMAVAAAFRAALLGAAQNDKLGGTKSAPMSVLTKGKADGPAIVRFSGAPQGFLVLMPMRGENGSLETALPAWFTDPVPAPALKKAA